MPRPALGLGAGTFVRGNADRDVLELSELGAAGARTRSAHELLRTRGRAAAHGRARVRRGSTFCHATPRSDDELVTGLTPDDELAAVL